MYECIHCIMHISYTLKHRIYDILQYQVETQVLCFYQRTQCKHLRPTWLKVAQSNETRVAPPRDWTSTCCIATCQRVVCHSADSDVPQRQLSIVTSFFNWCFHYTVFHPEYPIHQFCVSSICSSSFDTDKVRKKMSVFVGFLAVL